MKGIIGFTQKGKVVRPHFTVVVGEYRPKTKPRYRRFTLEPEGSEEHLTADDIAENIRRLLVGNDDGA